MTTSAAPLAETATSYEGFDFRQLWTGREAVTRLEVRLIRSALAGCGGSRLLEAGTGFGRLSGALASLTEEYVGVDLDPTQLGSVRDTVAATRGRPPELLAVANLFHLPFGNATFRVVVSVRVHHHIVDAPAFLRELGRVLAPGGLLLLSYAPKPTIATFHQDVRRFLAGRPGRVTFDRRASVACVPEPFPIVVSTRRQVHGDVRAAGFEVVREFAEGPERFAPWFASESAAGAPSVFPASFLFPTRFLLARRIGPIGGVLPPLREILACPRCHAPIEAPQGDSDWVFECRSCGQTVELRSGVWRTAYVPPDGELRTGGDSPERIPGPPRTGDGSGSTEGARRRNEGALA
ncbi:MAG: class I SAM-dependent methyltransferase [Thermoplasmata archaeon]|nr:class I SAM-dependent methyltransferase [Thermoplasmata archaeon]